MSESEPTADAPSPSFEEALAELEAIVHQLEDGQTGLAESLDRYEHGVRLLKQCYGLLQRAERRIELLTGVDAQGNPLTEPFDDQATMSLEEKGQTRSKRRSSQGAGGRKPRDPVPPSESDEPDEIDEQEGLF